MFVVCDDKATHTWMCSHKLTAGGALKLLPVVGCQSDSKLVSFS